MARATPVEEVEWTWGDKQVAFISTPARYAAFVGAMGCGKSSSMLRRALAIAYKYPGSRGMLARYTWSEVTQTLLPQFEEICPRGLIKRIHRSEPVEVEIWAQRGTSTILFRNLDDPRKFRSENISFFGVSQADDAGVTEDHWNELIGRLRRHKGPYGPIPRQYAFLEANYRGHNWIWQMFTREGQVASGRLDQNGNLRRDEKGNLTFDPSQYFLAEGQTSDNAQHLPEDYMREMMAMPEDWKKRHVFGSWDEMGGLVYDEFKPEHISPGVLAGGQWVSTDNIPDRWFRYRAIDRGTRNPTCCLWAAVSPSGTIYIYDEYYRPGNDVDHARAIFRKHSRTDRQGGWHPLEQYQWTVIPHDAYRTEGTSGEKPVEQYFAEGVPVVRAPQNDPWDGIVVVKKYLSETDPTTGRPRLQIVSGRAPNLVQEMRSYVWDELGPTRRTRRNEPERPRKINDHAVDALRYLLTSRPMPTPDTSPRAVDEHEKERRAQYASSWEV